MRVTSKARYAILILSELETSKVMRVQVISSRQDLSLFYIEKLLRKLRLAGLIISQRGPNGGYKLSKEPEKISFMEIFEAVGESIDFKLMENYYSDDCNNELPPPETAVVSRKQLSSSLEGLSLSCRKYLEGINLSRMKQVVMD